jgi:hypothetical protein
LSKRRNIPSELTRFPNLSEDQRRDIFAKASTAGVALSTDDIENIEWIYCMYVFSRHTARDGIGAEQLLAHLNKTLQTVRQLLLSDGVLSRAASDRLRWYEMAPEASADPSAWRTTVMTSGFTIQVFRTTNARVPRVSNLGQTLNALEELLSMNNHSMDDGSPSEAHAWITLVNELANIFRKHGTEPKAAKNKRDGYAKLSRFCQFVKAVLSAVPEELREHTQSDGTLAKHISDALIRPKDPVNTRPTERGVLASLRSAPPDGLRVSEIMTAAGIKTRAAADKLVRRMAAAGKIEQRGRGKYALPGVPPDTQTQR